MQLDKKGCVAVTDLFFLSIVLHIYRSLLLLLKKMYATKLC